MPLYVLERGQLVESTMPPALMSSLQPYQWELICRAMRGAEGQAHAGAFFLECVVCILFLFPFIFLCHPCCFLLAESGLKQSAANKLNRDMFGGAMVLRASNGKLMINTDLILNGGVSTMIMVPSHPSAMAQVTVIGASGYSQGNYNAHDGNVVVVQAHQPQPTIAMPASKGDNSPPIAVVMPVESASPAYNAPPSRSMALRLPMDARPGQQLTIMDPTGVHRQFIVESHHRPGQEVILPY